MASQESAETSENTPLIPSTNGSSRGGPLGKMSRSVTFNPTIASSSPPPNRGPLSASSSRTPGQVSTLHNPPRDGSQPMLSALNSKLRRRNSQGAPLMLPLFPGSKIGPQRTTRTAQKLKLLPNPEFGDDPDEESGREVYSQFTRIKDPTARRDAARLGKDDRDKLPRVTAYCTASSYRMDDLMRYLKGKTKLRKALPKQFDECIYSPYAYSKTERKTETSTEVRSSAQRRFSDSAIEVEGNAERRREDLMDFHTDAGDIVSDAQNAATANEIAHHELEHNDAAIAQNPEATNTPDFDTTVHIPEVFLFEYGVVVLWGMSVGQEQRFLKEIAKFETEKLSKDNIQVENFNFYYTKEYQARIYNDFISLREKKNYMTKLAISHALAQSTKTSLYEDLVDNTIDTTKEIPAQIAMTGKVNLSRREINMQIGELFILRINIHLQGSVLDAPELMWAEPQLDPIYQAVRSYLEMDQRVSLLTERLDVIADLLAVLKDQLTHTHGEYLEWIVIVLIAAEILVAAINIVVDLYAGVD
ncbi:hypothetical protein AAFC00_004023 [Neodothiora populina]|uniref:DUF155 domain-containing protein n=1 Tax=Neodothiora populina TaxID=2781224 RepID=A0ABR3PIM5_9PEZI